MVPDISNVIVPDTTISFWLVKSQLALFTQFIALPVFMVIDRAMQPVVSIVTVWPLRIVTESATVGATPPTQVAPADQLPEPAEEIAAIYALPLP